MIICFYSLSKSNGTYNWEETYQVKSDQPYGTSILHGFLKAYYDGHDITDLKRSLRHVLPNSDDGVLKNYIFVGESIMLDTADTDQLVNFVKQGNNALISSKTIPYDLMYFIYEDEDCPKQYWDDYNYTQDSITKLNLTHPDLALSKSIDYHFFSKTSQKSHNYRWTFIESEFICENGLIKLGYYENGNRCNFVRKKVGKGYFYLHSTPLAFTNFQLIDSLGIEYCNRVLSHLSPGEIYWDAYSLEKENIGRHRNSIQRNSPERKLTTENPFKYVLTQPPLRWAWYLSILLALLYLLFMAKRKQRIIPILKENKNNSLEFVYSIGSLYFSQSDHGKLCRQKMKLFKSYIRDHYHIATKDMDDAFIEKLAVKSEISKDEISKILSTYNNISESRTATSEELLIVFHRLLENFYKNCK